MTEEEWLEAQEPEGPLRLLAGKASDRKLRLFGVECCWLAQNRFVEIDPNILCWLDVIERYADGLASNTELEKVQDAAWRLISQYREVGPWSPELDSPEWVANERIGHAYEAVGYLSLLPNVNSSVLDHVVEALVHLQLEYIWYNSDGHPLLCDIFGNPFRPVTVDPAWLTADVLALARGIYDERAFDRMPILADALQDAGCDNDDVLNHCRDASATHVRGCWVVDLVLGKA